MIGQNALIQILSTALSAVITFFTLSFSARIFGPEILGNLAYLLSLTGLIFAFSDLGFSRAHIHYTAHSKNLGHNLGTFLTLKSILFLTSIFLAVGYYLLSNAPSYWLLFSLIIAYEILTRLSDSILITFEALQQSLPQNLIKLIAKLFRLVAILFMAKILVSDLGFSLTYLAEAIALIILSLWLLTRFKPLRFNPSLANKYLLYSLPFFAIIPLSYLQTNSLVLILRKFQPASEVGYYSAANQLVGFIKTLYAAVMIYFFPKISQFHQQNNPLAIKDYVQSAFRYLLTWFTPLFMFVYWFRQEVVLLILGPDFLPAVPVFSVFLLGIYLLMIIAPFDQVLFATKNHRPLVLVNFVSLILAVLVCWLLSPRFGAVGTVIASIIAWSASGVWHLILIKSRLKFKLSLNFPGLIIPAVCLTLLTQLIINYFHPAFMLKLLLSALTIIIYFSSLFIFKLITRQDIKYLKSIIKL